MKPMVIIVLAAGTAYAAHTEQPNDLAVYVEDAALVPMSNFVRAKGLASAVFRQIGVQVSISSKKPDGRVPAGKRMTVRIIRNCNASARDAVAYAYPFEGSTIVVCYDRLAWAEKSPILPPRLLAYVLVHEITHNIQGFPQHSETGIMKAHWDANDYADMARHGLSFTAEDVKLIEIGLEFRRTKAGSAMRDTFETLTLPAAGYTATREPSSNPAALYQPRF